jgi:hypothetical protein
VAELAALASTMTSSSATAPPASAPMCSRSACASMVLVVTTSDPSAATDAFGLDESAGERAARTQASTSRRPSSCSISSRVFSEAEQHRARSSPRCAAASSRARRVWPAGCRAPRACDRRAPPSEFVRVRTDKQGAATLRARLPRATRAARFLACGMTRVRAFRGRQNFRRSRLEEAMTDTPITEHPLSPLRGSPSGDALALAGGSLAALISLFFDAPVWVASLRGAPSHGLRTARAGSPARTPASGIDRTRRRRGKEQVTPCRPLRT